MSRASAQPALPGFGPDAGDGFVFTWWTTPEGARVWIEHRGRWRAGVIVWRGRKYVVVSVETLGGRHKRISKLYSELRRAAPAAR